VQNFLCTSLYFLIMKSFNEVKDHNLLGDFKDVKEFHISGDLLILYRINNDTLELLRIGTHSQLFK